MPYKQKFIPHSSGGWEVSDEGTSRFLAELAHIREEKALFSYKGTARALLLLTLHWVLQLQHMNWGGGGAWKNTIQFMAAVNTMPYFRDWQTDL